MTARLQIDQATPYPAITASSLRSALNAIFEVGMPHGMFSKALRQHPRP